VPVAVLLTVAGLHVPEIALVEVPGRMGAVAPLHIGAMALKVGVTLELTVTDSEVFTAHCPGLGVKV
jgi:hypothetical protein